MLSSMHVGCIGMLGMKISSFFEPYGFVCLQTTTDEDARMVERLGV